MKTKLDKYEEDIENNFEKQSNIHNAEHQIEQFKESAIQHQKRKSSITIHIADHDLEAIKLKASKKGLAYQTYINMIIHKAATKL